MVIRRIAQLISAGLAFAAIWMIENWKKVLLAILVIVLLLSLWPLMGILATILLFLGGVFSGSVSWKTILLLPVLLFAFLGVRALEKRKGGRAAIWFSLMLAVLLYAVGLICTGGPTVCTNPQMLVLAALLIGAIVGISYLVPAGSRSAARTVAATVLMIAVLVLLGPLVWNSIQRYTVMANTSRPTRPPQGSITAKAQVPIIVRSECSACLDPEPTPDRAWELLYQRLAPSPAPARSTP